MFKKSLNFCYRNKYAVYPSVTLKKKWNGWKCSSTIKNLFQDAFVTFMQGLKNYNVFGADIPEGFSYER